MTNKYWMQDVKNVRAPNTEGSTAWLVGATILAFGTLAAAAVYSSRTNSANVGFTPTANQKIEPRRQQFVQNCQERTAATLYDGTLGKITARRDADLRSLNYEGGCERWLCERVITEDGQERYKARFVPVGILECQNFPSSL
ncbi:MAG: hypothetical protein Q7K45_02980 [Nanoarchaeota archaeon]|nr:hypothetical protein [Nanoarchaeota archaeon]